MDSPSVENNSSDQAHDETPDPDHVGDSASDESENDDDEEGDEDDEGQQSGEGSDNTTWSDVWQHFTIVVSATTGAKYAHCKSENCTA